jgi:hypothetical protein
MQKPCAAIWQQYFLWWLKALGYPNLKNPSGPHFLSFCVYDLITQSFMIFVPSKVASDAKFFAPMTTKASSDERKLEKTGQ